MTWYFFLLILFDTPRVCPTRLLVCLWRINVGHVFDRDTTSPSACPYLLDLCLYSILHNHIYGLRARIWEKTQILQV